jgi:hypothetical protein
MVRLKCFSLLRGLGFVLALLGFVQNPLASATRS